jgi:hypothetical protein
MAYNPNSALYWYPKLADIATDIPVGVPDSRLVKFPFDESFRLLDGEVPDALPWGAFVEAAEAVGSPAFVRTDQKSAKHAGPGAYRIDDPGEDIPTALAALVDHHVTAGRNPAALMVREWVDIDAKFRAFDGLAIGPEWRLFASPDGAQCRHFYWPAAAIAEGRGEPTGLGGEPLAESVWRSRLNDLRESATSADLRHLDSVATAAARALNTANHLPDDGIWSVDFARGADGEWWLIDVARAPDSWHPDDCPHS